jgi:hypothetical protein
MSIDHLMYQYRRDNNQQVETLLERALWMSDLAHLNDPFELHTIDAFHGKPAPLAEFQSIGIACFCRAKTNPLLWSHYADGHRGFAVGLEIRHASFGLSSGFDDRLLHDVVYEDIPPRLTDFRDERSFFTGVVLTKPTVWAHEQETRIVARKGQQRVNDFKDAFKQVLFGAKMPAARMKEIKELCIGKGWNFEFFKMEQLKNAYAVVPTPYI